MKNLFYSVFVTLLFSLSALAQTEGINFQGVARNAAGEVLVNQQISLRLSILMGSESGTVAYSETRLATTNPQGIFAVVVGDGTAASKTGNFSSIDWGTAPKFIKVEMDPTAGTNFLAMGTTRMQAVSVAFYAYQVDASNVKGVLPVGSGGTGVASIPELKTSLSLDQVNNTSDANKPLSAASQAALATKANASDVTASLATKVDKVSGKDLSTNDYSTAEKTKLAAITGTNTGDQDLSAYATTAQVATKANAADVTTSLATKANASDVTTSLATKANTADVTTSLATKVDKVTGKELSTNDYTTAEKTKLAAITGTNTGDQDLSAYATTAQVATKANASDVTTSLATKANASDVTTSLATKATASDVTASLATKVDKVTGKELSTNDYTTAEKDKLAAITGTNTGDQVNITGNAGTATKLQSSVTINGIAFDGSANITVPAGVPYTGATQAVNLGAFNLTVNGITVGRGGGSDSTNTAIGYLALTANTTGINNTANGSGALTANTTGDGNTGNGLAALFSNISGNGNTASGGAALYSNTTGDGNTAIGGEALALNTSGSSNTAIGAGALSSNSTGEFNTAIGYLANVGSDSLANATAIGNGAIVESSNTIQLGNTDVTNVKTSGTLTAAGMGLGVSAPNASAILEASSTTQGFLPPRLTTTERDAIANPVAGLTIWNSTNTQLEVYDGSYWKNMVGLLVSPLQVGDEYGGGKVFYIFGPSDNGYIKGQTHGLIAATVDQTTDAGVKWFPDKFYGATGTYIGLGLPNTLGIIAAAVITGTTNMSSFAAGLANSYRGGGYVDWYLPSKDELNLLYQAKDAIGGFATSGHPTYWSSTQKGGISFTNFSSFANGVESARTQFFFTTTGSDGKVSGTQSDLGINNPRRVRAIRMF
jgi:hypothetical protein